MPSRASCGVTRLRVCGARQQGRHSHSPPGLDASVEGGHGLFLNHLVRMRLFSCFSFIGLVHRIACFVARSGEKSADISEERVEQRSEAHKAVWFKLPNEKKCRDTSPCPSGSSAHALESWSSSGPGSLFFVSPRTSASAAPLNRARRGWQMRQVPEGTDDVLAGPSDLCRDRRDRGLGV